MFSPVTIVEVFALLENWKHHEIDRLLLKYALETAAPAPQNSTSARATLLMKYLIDHPEDVGPSGKSLSFELIEELFEREAPTELESRIPNGINSLKRDGFVVDGKKLRRSLPEELQLPKADDELHSLLKRHSGLRHLLVIWTKQSKRIRGAIGLQRMHNFVFSSRVC